MEKKNEKKAEMKVVREESQNNEVSKKLSYEELENIALQSRKQNAELYQRLQQVQNVLAEVNQIGLLLDILGKAEHFKESFVNRCASKIEELVGKAMDESEKEAATTEESK